jgi:hypothetical protein
MLFIFSVTSLLSRFVIYRYINSLSVSVGGWVIGHSAERFLWPNRSHAFSMAEPATENAPTDPGPESHLGPESQMQQLSYTIVPAPKMARITNSVITHRSSGLTNGSKLN